MNVLPQVLINVNVRRKPPLEEAPEIESVIRQVEKELGGKGRVLVRYSGTQPMCRVMVEGLNNEDIKIFSNRIAQAIQGSIGS
jgi:phosphoglucosamine mutase